MEPSEGAWWWVNAREERQWQEEYVLSPEELKRPSLPFKYRFLNIVRLPLQSVKTQTGSELFPDGNEWPQRVAFIPFPASAWKNYRRDSGAARVFRGDETSIHHGWRLFDPYDRIAFLI